MISNGCDAHGVQGEHGGNPSALLATAEALGWPAVAVGLIRVRVGEIAWRQMVTLATEAERQRLAAWLVAAVDQATAAADGRVPVVVLVQVRQGVPPRRLVVLDWSTWLDLHGPAGPEGVLDHG